MKKFILMMLTLGCAAALGAAPAAGSVKKVVLTPFKKAVKANSIIVRTKTARGKTYNGKVSAKITDGDFVLEQKLAVIDLLHRRYEVDYELCMDKVREFSPATKLELTLDASEKYQPKIYEVRPVVFDAKDLSKGLTFETADRRGVWVAHDRAKARLDGQRGLSGKYCLRATWPGASGMISLLPGERDWRKYAVLRFTLANPHPGVDGHRARVMFLYDGKTIQRPHKKDLPSQGGLRMSPEGVKTFDFDLKLFAKNNRKFKLNNVRSLQLFWSPKKTPATTFYIDNVQLLTQAQLDAEDYQRYGSKIDAVKKTAAPDNKLLNDLIARLEKRFAAGERSSLEPLLEKAGEISVAQKLAKKQDFLLLSADASDKVMRDEMPAETAFPVKLSAAGNERESFQLVVVPGKELKSVEVASSALVNGNGTVIPASAVTVNPVGYVQVRDNSFNYKGIRTGMWPDILLKNQKLDLPVRMQPYMITVAVPKNQQPGVYKGTLTVKAENAKTQTVDYELKVYNFSLPVRGEMHTWFSLSYLPDDPGLRRKIYDAYFDHRLNPTGMYSRINKPQSGRKPGRFLPPVEDVPYCLERGMNYMSIGYLINRYERDPHAFDDDYIQAAVDWVGKYRPTLEKMGAWGIVYVNGFDEIMHKDSKEVKKRLAQARKICGALKKAHPGLKIANIGRLMDISPEYMDAWFMAPNSGKNFEHIKKAGKMAAFYTAYGEPGFMLDQPGISPRIFSWLIYKEGCSGMGFYSTIRLHAAGPQRTRNLERHHKQGITYCGEECFPAKVPEGVDWMRDIYNCEGTYYKGRNGDGVLFYPAKDRSLLASQRLTNIRDGIEDFEYFKILEKLPGDHQKLLTIGDDIVTVRNGDYTTDIAKLNKQRNAVAEQIEKAMKK